ncbi:hypothetical protein DM02DRAFT_715209 [Periconia macrospinosa]|uniref:Uncharacterized protein n=1 Tax=Periconia macrospinosa TaxID=97972 RepID=A0A2V1E8B8_9PLEO|nr:hypothetical protein DM02DRAFT_715209 [Periconia macrospinosa]
MTVSAVDVITYVGIPLAVLGVLPTIYTCLKSFFTLREITKTLHRNGVAAITRSALLSGIVEIEIPRRSITPLNRNDPKYFGLRETPSKLKGGTWTLFEWKEMVIGVKSYRLQYHDELTQPQAEIDFEALVAFLLDRGAVPNKEGWADLRSSGLWTPVGTRLLLSPVSAEEALSVAMSDDSDGILSLSLNWDSQWDRRGRESLPPYWVKVDATDPQNDVVAAINAMEAQKGGASDSPHKSDGFLDDDSAASFKLGINSAIRLKISATGIQECYSESDPEHSISLFHLHSSHTSPDSTAGFWASCAATALQAPQGGLWSFSIPADVLAIARRETVPCGVMVLLQILTDDEVPVWRATAHEQEAERFERHVRFTEQTRKMNEENRLPPALRDEARRKRLEADAMDFHNEFRRKQMRDEQRREAQVVDAIQSQRLPFPVIVEANLRFLHEKLRLAQKPVIQELLEQILYAMIQDAAFSRRIATMMDLWRSWTQSGGMTKSHYLAVKEDQITFALASVIWAAMREMVNEPMGSVVGDLQECLRMWKKVRLG